MPTLPFILVGLLAAEPIPVDPGPNAISVALKSAKPGDTLRLSPGAYVESVTLPDGISLEGAGADSTYLTGVKLQIISCEGENRISGLTFVGTRDAERGIVAKGPVRIEHCSFDRIFCPTVLCAPLSDIIACDFVRCDGPENRSGSPTIWGCQFIDGLPGLTAGGPYIRNCVFWNHWNAICLIPYSKPARATIRNCLFHNCNDCAIKFMALPPRASPPFIHNNIFEECHIAVRADKRTLAALRDCLVDRGRIQMLQDEQRHDVPHTGMKGIVEGDARSSLTGGRIEFINPRAVIEDQTGRVRALSEFGPEKEWATVGSLATATLPPIRFGVPVPIVNSEREEEQVAAHKGLTFKSRERVLTGPKPLDRLACEHNGERVTLTFDITRIIEEERLTGDPPK